MGLQIRRAAFWLALLLVLSIVSFGGALAGEVKTYETKYYTFQSDADPLVLREATLRMTYFVEEYGR